MSNRITWHQLPTESPSERNARLNELLHRIFFDSNACCTDNFLLPDGDNFECLLCGVQAYYPDLVHSTPRFLESLDAMQLVVESGKFAEVREEFYHWLAREGKPAHDCRILLYKQGEGEIWFQETGKTRQDAFYCAALKAVGYETITEVPGDNR